MPQKALGARIEPPWSPPMAMLTSSEPTMAAHPEVEPPDMWLGLCGLRVGPVGLVDTPPENEKYSQWPLPTISPPASRILVTTVASTSGTYPSSVEAPFIIGTPARQMLSLRTIVLPWSAPRSAPLMVVFTYQAFSG